jgi:hypothetical protein
MINKEGDGCMKLYKKILMISVITGSCFLNAMDSDSADSEKELSFSPVEKLLLLSNKGKIKKAIRSYKNNKITDTSRSFSFQINRIVYKDFSDIPLTKMIYDKVEKIEKKSGYQPCFSTCQRPNESFYIKIPTNFLGDFCTYHRFNYIGGEEILEPQSLSERETKAIDIRFHYVGDEEMLLAFVKAIKELQE